MDAGVLPRLLINTNGGAAGGNHREKPQNAPPLVGSATRRNRLSDITNTVSSGRAGMVDADLDQGNSKVAPCPSSKDCIVQLMKENTALLKLLAEKNEIIKLSSIELQKLRFELQKTNQQNWQLARTNSHMLAELNLGKDRLKSLQHELGCTSSILKLKASELEEKENVIKELLDKFGTEVRGTKCEEVEANATQIANDKKTCNPNKKRKLKDQSLGSTILVHQVASGGKVDGRRRSLRTKSSDLKPESCEVVEGLLKVDDARFPMTHQVAPEEKVEGRRRRSLLVKSCNLKSESCESVEELLNIGDTVIPLAHQVASEQKAAGRRKSLRRRSSNLKSESCESTKNTVKMEDAKFLVYSIKNEHLLEETIVQPDSSTSNSNICVEQVKNEAQDSGGSSELENQGLQRRSSVGRPLRKAAEKISSYKEMNLNVKMRRPE